MEKKKKILCFAIIQLATSLGIFTIGFYVGENQPEKPNQVLKKLTLYRMLSNNTLCELLLNLPINAKWLHEILFYDEQNRLIGVIPSKGICTVKKQLSDCSRFSCAATVPFLSRKEPEMFFKFIEIVKCE